MAPAEAARVHEGSPASRRRVATAIGALAGAAAAGLPALAMVSSEVPGPSIVLVAAGALAGALLGWALRRPDAAP